MPRLTSVHVNIFPILKSGDVHKRHACAMRRDTSETRKRRRANIPTSWQKLTQAQMYLTNSPLLCMFKCEPDGSEQWGLARCLIVCGGYRRMNTRADKSGGAGFLQKGPQIPLSLTMIQWFNSFQHQILPTHGEPLIQGGLASSCFHFLLYHKPTLPAWIRMLQNQPLKSCRWSHVSEVFTAWAACEYSQMFSKWSGNFNIVFFL